MIIVYIYRYWEIENAMILFSYCKYVFLNVFGHGMGDSVVTDFVSDLSK